MKLTPLARRRTAGALTLISFSGLCAATLTPAQAQATLTTVASFSGANGRGPVTDVTFDSQGNLFGTTFQGGANDDGTVYEIASGSTTLTTLASFTGSNGSDPTGSMIFDSSGNLFGTTHTGGGANSSGTVYEIAKGSATITTLAAFPGTTFQGSSPGPLGSIALDSQGNLFGATYYGGANNAGTVFEIAKNSATPTTLASFAGPNGANPAGGVTLDSQGNLFGTTLDGGVNNNGTVFEIAKGSTIITTLTFFTGTNGAEPLGNVIFDGSGNLFGTTYIGGANNGSGTVYEIAKGSTTLTTLASFNLNGSNGLDPESGVTLDNQGNLFGTTNGGGTNNDGTVFEIAKGSSVITTLATFNGLNGAMPTNGVTFDGQGNLFGTTQYGGANSNGTFASGGGVVYEIAGVGSPAAVPEASTTVSFGLLLTLGLGGVILARRKRTQNAAPAAENAWR